jgi:hypothetical protein
MANSLTIKEFLENTGIIVSEAAGAGFTGELLFKVNMRNGGISTAFATRSGEIISGGELHFGAPPKVIPKSNREPFFPDACAGKNSNVG